MSTTFDVFPASTQAPRFGEVAALAHRRLTEFATAYQLGPVPTIGYALHDAEERVTDTDPAGEMIWPEESYVWFQFGEAPGGTDAYCRPVAEDEELFASLASEIESRPAAQKIAPLVRQCLQHRRRWWFRRSAGQPAIVNLGYGYLAASLAELTGGIIFSGDSAWEYERFPCLAADFYTFYFRPELALEPGHREWCARNIEHLRNEGMQA